MREVEFDERIKSIKESVDHLNENPIIRINAGFRKDVINIASNISQIEIGIKQYNRPKEWDLIQEGLTNKRG